MRAIGYARVSSQEQVEGTSLKVQEQQIRAYALMKGIDLVDVLLDGGVSGGKPLSTRPEGTKLTAMVEADEVQAVVIVKLDRGFRSASDCLNCVEDWDRRKVALHIVDLGGTSIDTTSPTGKFMLTVLAAAAEMERGMIRDRCNAGRRARKAEGKRIGEVPFGWTLDVDGKTLNADPQEQEAIALAQSMHQGGHSLRSIAEELARREIPSKKGGAWSHKQVASLLRRAA